MGLTVRGGAAGVAATLEDLDVLVVALARAAEDAARLAGAAVRAAADPELLAGARVDPLGVARVVAEVGLGAGAFCRGAGVLAALSVGVAGAVAAYRAREEALAAAARGVPPAVGAVVRTRLGVAGALLPVPAGPGAGWLLTGAGAAVAAGVLVPAAARDPVRHAAVELVVAHPVVVDLAVRTAPGLLGVPDVPAAARFVGAAGQAGGVFVETPVRVRRLGPATACAGPGSPDGRAAGGVADLLRRGQSVAAWRVPGPGGHDSLPPGEPRPVRGQVRVDRVVGPDGAVAWVVHVPGTQDWDGDGEGSPMDMAANVALVGGRPSAVAEGVAAALAGAGARPGQPVLLVGHSQGGMTAAHLAADPVLRRTATVTHVVTAGSPLTGRPVPPGVQVLALEHPDDLVPRLDGRDHPEGRDRVVVRSPAPRGPWGLDPVPAHSSSAYVVTAAAVDRSTHPSLVAHRAGLAPFLDRPGATCTSTQVVLRRTGPDVRPGPR